LDIIEKIIRDIAPFDEFSKETIDFFSKNIEIYNLTYKEFK
jgi:hypothetical protein